jgi:hypothetical protein
LIVPEIKVRERVRFVISRRTFNGPRGVHRANRDCLKVRRDGSRRKLPFLRVFAQSRTVRFARNSSLLVIKLTGQQTVLKKKYVRMHSFFSRALSRYYSKVSAVKEREIRGFRVAPAKSSGNRARRSHLLRHPAVRFDYNGIGNNLETQWTTKLEQRAF